MKILILQGNPVEDPEFDVYVEQLKDAYISRGFTAEVELLREKDIKACTGCFHCWIKTPGECVIRDDAVSIAQKYMAADYVIFASPVIAGFMSSLSKNTADRCIPIVHPHLEEVGGEMHHKKRYEKYPRIGILLQKEEDTDDEDIEIMHELFERMCINMRTELEFVEFTDRSLEEVGNAINVH
jgi:multimeric flavodoxin WrbA